MKMESLLRRRGFEVISGSFRPLAFNSNYLNQQRQLTTSGGSLIPFQQHSQSNLWSFLVGNTRTLWPRFTQNISETNLQLIPENPFDEFIEREIGQEFLADLQRDCGLDDASFVSIHYAHRRYEGDQFIPFQRLANYCALAYFEPNSHLLLHPIYGPWFALRAVVTIDLSGNESLFKQLPSPRFDLENDWERLAATERLQSDTKPNETVQADVKTKMISLLSPVLQESKDSRWKQWVSLRDLVGGNRYSHWRYSDQQLEYHYTKNLDCFK